MGPAFSDNNGIGGPNFLYANTTQTHICECWGHSCWSLLSQIFILVCLSSYHQEMKATSRQISFMMYFVLSIFQFFLLFVQRNWDGWERWSVKSCVKQPLPAWQRTPYLWQEVSWHTESAQDSRCQRKLLEDEEKI